MNNIRLYLFSVLILSIPPALVAAQSRKQESQEKQGDEDLDSQIGSEIEKFVDRVIRTFAPDRAQDERFFEDDSLPSKRKRRVSADLESESNTMTFQGNKTIEASETVSSSVVVKAGDLTVYGTIDGDVLVVGGNLYVKDGGRITGNVRVISGDVVKDDGGTIEGYIDKTSASTASYREDRRRFVRSATSFNAPWLTESTALDNFLFRYNRVEGFFLGLGTEKKYYWDGRKSFNSYGSIGYGFKSHTWRYNLGVTRQFALGERDENNAGSHLLQLGVEGYSLTDTKDQWLINLHENTAAALLIHEDFRDYFQRNGATVWIGHYTQREYFNTELKLEYRMDAYSSLSNNAEWSIFGGEKVFRLNPSIDNGTMRSVFGTAGFSTISKTVRGPEGWSIYGTGEVSDKNFGSEWNFNQYILDVRRFQPLSRYDNFNIRLRAGSAEGSVPVQKIFELGGLGTLEAFPFKSEFGNRMVLLNAEYIVNGDFLSDLDFWPSWLMRRISLLFLTDAGFTRLVPGSSQWTSGFEGIRWSEFKNDVGVGVSNRNGSYRFAVVWRTDVSESARFVFRFTRPF